MRALIPLPLLIALGCGQVAPTPAPAPGAPTARGARRGFDPNSEEATLDWAAGRLLEAERAAADNEAARKESLDRYAADMAAMEGKPIRWSVPAGKVNARSECCVRTALKQLPAAGGGDTAGRDFFLCVVQAKPKESAADLGKRFAPIPESGFPASPPKADWAKSLTEWAPVTLVGKIDKVSADRKYLILAVSEGHVEKP
jgi:hypothetical protein